MPDTATTKDETLEQKMRRYTATFASRREDWDVFGFETKQDKKFARAQRRYVGASGSTAHQDAKAIPAHAHTLSIMMVPPGHEQPMHGHETEEIFFVLEGECTVVWQKDGERAEVKLGKWDMILSPPTADHCIINHSDQPCWFQVMLGKAKPNRPNYTDPELRRLQADAVTG